ncbi:TRAP transporter small permease [Pelagovum sp. HNIBRBA483]|uniref:TRAP transporter small permease n=1 Tax=Pelagovum sp. HNIBRBA483 TaxID=3233341 RepID=UPI0034A2BC25
MHVIISPLELVITYGLRLGRWIATGAIAVMVIVILIQVFFRYVLNNAQAWPDEAARFCMLWMTGFMAPSAYRWGGFVSIDMFRDMLGRRAGLILNLVILVISFGVLMIAMQLGLKHINSGWLFNSSSLKVPLNLIGGDPIRLKLAWMYMSVYVGFIGMIIVNVEMILKNLHMLFSDVDYGDVPDQRVMSAE